MFIINKKLYGQFHFLKKKLKYYNYYIIKIIIYNYNNMFNYNIKYIIKLL